MLDYIIVIPARYKSSRFPGKPLALIKGKTLLERVWDQCSKAAPKDKIYIATDNKKIYNYCLKKKYQCLMTSTKCLTGTDRVYELSKKIKSKIYINVQGDEPLILPKDIKKIIKYSLKYPNYILNGMCKINNELDYRSFHVPKVVVNNNNFLLYMSRGGIPSNKKNEFVASFKQVCIYAFPRKALTDFSKINKKTFFENIEDIEILRFLELGYSVKMINVSQSSIGVDTPEDINRVNKYIKN